jgi:predicted O-methyltransferase YrrM
MNVTLEGTDIDGICYTFVNGVKGTLNGFDAFTLIEHAKEIPNGGRYVETGSYLGCSALIVALHSSATVWAHDLWTTDWSELRGAPPPEVQDYFYVFYTGVKANKLENRIIPIRGRSAYTVGIHDDKSIDLAFIDGDHSFEGCLADLIAILPKMKKGSTILIHDCTESSEPLAAVSNFCKSKNLTFSILPSTTGMAKIKL